MLYKHGLIFLMGLALFFTGCNQATPVPTPDLSIASNTQVPADSPNLGFDGAIEWVECSFDTDDMKPQCGYLTVPLDYASQSSGKTLRLGFAVYKTSNANPQPDPVIFVSASAYTSRSRFFTFRFEQILTTRDVIAFDLRGTGLSEPVLACPEIAASAQEAAASGGLAPEQWQAAHEQCRQTLEGQSINLNSYNIANLSGDLKALRLALGYAEWNMMANDSLAATLVQDQLQIDPEGVRSVLLDGALPFSVVQTQDYGDAQRVLKEFFGLCAQDTQCAGAFPELETVFYQAVGQLNAEPVEAEIKNLSTGTSTKITVKGEQLISLVLSNITGGQEQNLGLLPRMIYQLKDGNTETLAQIAGNSFSDLGSFSDSFSTLIRCRQVPPNEDQINRGLSTIAPELAEYFQESAQISLAVCDAWQTPDPIPPSTTSSLKPVLLFQGSWNWSGTPPSSVEQFKQLAPNTQVITIPMRGRFSLFSRNSAECTQSILNAFVENPNAQADTQCLPTGLEITWITLQ